MLSGQNDTTGRYTNDFRRKFHKIFAIFDSKESNPVGAQFRTKLVEDIKKDLAKVKEHLEKDKTHFEADVPRDHELGNFSSFLANFEKFKNKFPGEHLELPGQYVLSFSAAPLVSYVLLFLRSFCRVLTRYKGDRCPMPEHHVLYLHHPPELLFERVVVRYLPSRRSASSIFRIP